MHSEIAIQYNEIINKITSLFHIRSEMHGIRMNNLESKWEKQKFIKVWITYMICSLHVNCKLYSIDRVLSAQLINLDNFFSRYLQRKIMPNFVLKSQMPCKIGRKQSYSWRSRETIGGFIKILRVLLFSSSFSVLSQLASLYHYSLLFLLKWSQIFSFFN